MPPTVVLFDVDGTLINSGRAGRRALEAALSRRGAPASTGFSFAGMTDRAIVRTALNNAGLPTEAHHIDEVLREYLARLEAEVRAAADFHIHAGVLSALAALEAEPDVALGLGTGNIERGARIKLARVDLARRFRFGGFGSDAEQRPRLLECGARRGADQLGQRRERCRVVVVGDTPKDIAAAKAIGAVAIAVATGPFSCAELAQHQPELALERLDDPSFMAELRH